MRNWYTVVTSTLVTLRGTRARLILPGMTNTKTIRRNWHTVTLLNLAITKAVLAGDARGEAVLLRILAEEMAVPPP
jgi:hypothetical protein